MNLSNLTFKSGHHYRIENGVEVGGGAANRIIRIEDSISGNEGYSVTIYDQDGVHPLWKDNVSMSTKPMKIISSSMEKTEMRGWGTYVVPLAGFTVPYSNYGITIHHPAGQVEKIVLHMFDRNINIRYEL